MEKRRLHMQAPLSSFVVQGKIFRNEAWRSGSTQNLRPQDKKDSIISRVYVIHKKLYVSFVQTLARPVKCFWFNQMLNKREAENVEVLKYEITKLSITLGWCLAATIKISYKSPHQLQLLVEVDEKILTD